MAHYHNLLHSWTKAREENTAPTAAGAQINHLPAKAMNPQEFHFALGSDDNSINALSSAPADVLLDGQKDNAN